MDMSSMVSSMMGVHAQDEGDGEQHDLDAVYSNNIMYDMMSSFASAETQTNNLKDFKTYLEGDNELSQHISSISYDYDLGMSIYAKDTDGKVFKSDVTELLQTCMSELYGGDYSSYFERFGSAYSAMEPGSRCSRRRIVRAASSWAASCTSSMTSSTAPGRRITTRSCSSSTRTTKFPTLSSIRWA